MLCVTATFQRDSKAVLAIIKTASSDVSCIHKRSCGSKAVARSGGEVCSQAHWHMAAHTLAADVCVHVCFQSSRGRASG